MTTAQPQFRFTLDESEEIQDQPLSTSSETSRFTLDSPGQDEQENLTAGELIKGSLVPIAGFRKISEKKKARQIPEERKATSFSPVEEKTPEEIKQLSVGERFALAQDISRERQEQQAKGLAKAVLPSPGLVKGGISGATLGASETIPGFAPKEGEVGFGTGKFVGSILPINKLSKVFGGIGKVAAKSPVLAKPLQALGNIIGAGATGASLEALEETFRGEFPDAAKIAQQGAIWSLLDVGLRGLGLGGRFAANLLKRAKSTKTPPHEVINDVMNELRDQGVDFSVPERVSAKALAVLEQDIPEATKAITLPEKAAPTVLEDVAKERFQEVEKVSTDLQTKKVTPQRFEKLTEKEIPFAKAPELKEIDFGRASKDLETSGTDQKINELFPKQIRAQELGTQVQENLNTALERSSNIYTPLYDQAKEAAQFINITPRTVANRGKALIQDLESLKTRPAGFQNVIKTVENILDDIGFTVQRSEDGVLENIFAVDEAESVGIDRLIELGKRLSEVVNYDIEGFKIQDRLKPIINGIKKDIRKGLSKNPDALNAFEAAEKLFGDTAEVFDNKFVKQVRLSETPEDIVKNISSASNLEKLKEILQPEEMASVERELIEQLKDKNHKEAKKLFNELKPHLSEDAKKVGEEVVDSKLPFGTKAKTLSFQRSIADDLSDAIVTGKRPSKVLDLWKTPKGQNLIKDALKNNPNKGEIIDYLKQQSFFDFASSYVKKDGTIEIKKLNDLLRDKNFRFNLRNVGGDEALRFFDNLKTRVGQFEKNLSLLDRLPPKIDSKRGTDLIERARKKNEEVPPLTKLFTEKTGRFEEIFKEGKVRKGKFDFGETKLGRLAAKNFPLRTKVKAFLESLGLSAKAAIGLTGIVKFGFPNTAAAFVSFKILDKMARSPRVRRAFTEATAKPKDLNQYINAWNRLGKVLDEEDKN